MSYSIARVILDLALDKEFDYLIPAGVTLKKGMRVLVDFRGKERVGIVSALARQSSIKNLKPIIEVLDSYPLVSAEHFRFARYLSKLYPYAWQEFIFMFLPAYLKQKRKINLGLSFKETQRPFNLKPTVFIRADTFPERYSLWRERVKEALRVGSVLICFPQVPYLEEAQKIIQKDFCQGVRPLYSQEGQRGLFLEWQKSRLHALILGTRLAIFYYPLDLALLVIEEENNPYYFQEEKPYHHLLEVAFLLSRMKKIELVLAGDYPTLYTYKLIKAKRIIVKEGNCSKGKKVQVLESQAKGSSFFGPLFWELLRKNILEKKRVVILLNKRGEASAARCLSCGYVFSCNYCSGALQLFLKENYAQCVYCGRRLVLSEFCPRCKSGYFKGFGFGLERLKSLLRRNFIDVQIEDLEKRTEGSQILLSTSKILSLLYGKENFAVGFLLDTDIFLSRLDYEATFHTFLYIRKLARLFSEVLYVFTSQKEHYLFSEINNWEGFYEKELSLRKEFFLPPYGAVANISLRAQDQERLLKMAKYLYNNLKARRFEAYGPFKGHPFKKHGRFYYLLTLKSKNKDALRMAIKEEIKRIKTPSVKTAVVIR